VTLFSSLTNTITKASDILFTGTVTSPTWGGNAAAPIFDGNIATSYHGNGGDAAQMDLGAGNEKKLTLVRYYPDPSVGGYFQGRVESNLLGSNDGVNFTQILHIPSAEGTGVQWYEISSSATETYRYFRVVGGPEHAFWIAELELYGVVGGPAPTAGPTAVPTETPVPTPVPTAGPTAVPTAGPTAVPTAAPTAAPTATTNLLSGTVISDLIPANAALAFDTNINTNFIGGTTSWVGLDLGAGNEKKLTLVRYYPVAGADYVQDRVESNLQGSNDGTNYTTILHIPGAAGLGVHWYEISSSADDTYRYFRVKAGATDRALWLAELEFYGIVFVPTPTPSPTPTPDPNATPSPTPTATAVSTPTPTPGPINLLAVAGNMGFESGGWGPNLTVTTVDPGQGAQSGVAAAGGWTGRFLSAPRLEDNTTYTFSYLIKTDGIPSNCLININYVDGISNDFKNSGPAYTGNSTSWTKYTSTFTTGSGVKVFSDGQNWMSVTCWSATKVYIDDLRLVIGSEVVVTATPSPTLNPNATPTPTPDLRVSQKIMCIGDSITQGTGGVGGVGVGKVEYSWRYPLWKMLIDNNAKFEFVGSRNIGFDSNPTYADYKGNVFSNKHEGYWGWAIQSVTIALATSLTTITPDIAIIYLGTNDWETNETVPAKVAAMRLLIEKLRVANPNIKILLGKPSQTWFGEMQTAFGALANELNTISSPVIAIQNATPWVDDPTAVGSCTNDWIHTNTVGDQKMANVILPVLASAMGFLPATPTPTPTPIATATPLPVPVTAVLLLKTTVALKVPMTLQLIATLIPSNATNKEVSWTSSNIKVATVSLTGKVTAKGSGTAIIKVKTKSGAFTRTCKVTVTQPVTKIKLNKKTASISKGKTLKLVATISPANASNKKVIWKSSNTKIATVSVSGLIKGRLKGTCYITVTTVDGKKSAKCKITVK